MNETSKNRLLILVIAFLLLTNISMIIFCFMRSPDRKGSHQEEKMKRGDGVTEMLRNQVGFTDEQMKQYEQLRNDHWKRMKPLFDSIRLSKQEFYKLLSQPSLQDTAWQRAANRIGETQKAIDMELFDHFRQVKAICTPPQQPKYDSLVQTVVGKMMFAFRKGGPSFRKDSTGRR